MPRLRPGAARGTQGGAPQAVLLEHLPLGGAAGCAHAKPPGAAGPAPRAGGRAAPGRPSTQLSVRGVLFRLCSACHLMTTQYLLDQHVPATEIGTVPSPAVSQTPRAQPPGPARPGVGPARPTRLLIVEDDDAVRVALQLTLTRFGYTVLAEARDTPVCAAPTSRAPTSSCWT